MVMHILKLKDMKLEEVMSKELLDKAREYVDGGSFVENYCYDVERIVRAFVDDIVKGIREEVNIEFHLSLIDLDLPIADKTSLEDLYRGKEGTISVHFNDHRPYDYINAIHIEVPEEIFLENQDLTDQLVADRVRKGIEKVKAKNRELVKRELADKERETAKLQERIDKLKGKL